MLGEACEQRQKASVVLQVFMDWTRAVAVLQVLIQACLSGKARTLEKTLGHSQQTSVWMESVATPDPLPGSVSLQPRSPWRPSRTGTAQSSAGTW